MRKEIVAAAMVAALTLVGCSETGEPSQTNQQIGQTETDEDANSNQPVENEGAAPTPKLDRSSASVGEAIPVSTDYGDLNVTIDGFMRSASVSERERERGDLPDGMSMCILTMLVENVSYDSSHGSDSVFLDGYIYVNDPDGITINAEGSAGDYGQYEAAPGYAFGCNIGQKKRIAVPFVVSDTVNEVTVVTDSHEIVVPVTNGD